MKLHVETSGDGAPLLFLGGSSWDLRHDRAAFGWAPRARVTTFDQRGLGRSEAPTGTWTMADYVADALLAMEDVPVFDLVGYSFGSMVAQHLAASATDRIARLALIAAGPGGAMASYPLHDLAALPHEERARTIIPVQDIRKNGKVEQSEVVRVAARMAEKEAAAPDGGPARLLAIRAAHDATAVLDRITAPTLVIGGLHDGQAPRPIVEALAARIDGARLLLIPGGHNFALDPDGPLQALARLWEIGPVTPEARGGGSG